MIGRTSFRCHIRVSGILDISFLRARIPFQQLTCYSFCKSAVQPLPRTFLKNRRAFVLSLRISRSTFGRSIISEGSQSSINARRAKTLLYRHARVKFVLSYKKGTSIRIPRIERREWVYYVPDTYFEIRRSRNLQLSFRKICQFFEADYVRNNITYLVSSRVHRCAIISIIISGLSYQRCLKGARRLLSRPLGELPTFFADIFVTRPTDMHRSKSHAAAVTSESLSNVTRARNLFRIQSRARLARKLRKEIRTKRAGSDETISRIYPFIESASTRDVRLRNTSTFHYRRTRNARTHARMHVFPSRAESTVSSRRC